MPTWVLAPLGWEAIATFTTGGLAVWAAYKVGRRQIKISKKQTEIADAVRALEAQKIKIDLFEQRLQIYRQVKFWLDNFYSTWEELPNEAKQTYLKHCDEALYLFGQDMFDRMQGWCDDKVNYLGARGQEGNGIEGAREEYLEIGSRIENDKKSLRSIFQSKLDLSNSH